MNAADRGRPCKRVVSLHPKCVVRAEGFIRVKSEKEWTCPMCGVVHDRDENAALNLIKLGKIHFEEVKK